MSWGSSRRARHRRVASVKPAWQCDQVHSAIFVEVCFNSLWNGSAEQNSPRPQAMPKQDQLLGTPDKVAVVTKGHGILLAVDTQERGPETARRAKHSFRKTTGFRTLPRQSKRLFRSSGRTSKARGCGRPQALGGLLRHPRPR